jgi:hypothetical protein
VQNYGEVALRGEVAPSPANQCWPEPLPFMYKNLAMQPDQDHEFRHVRMNQQHPVPLTPSWYRDSVGCYEGDTW